MRRLLPPLRTGAGLSWLYRRALNVFPAEFPFDISRRSLNRRGPDFLRPSMPFLGVTRVRCCGLRFDQRPFLGAPASANHGEQIARDLVRGSRPGGVVLPEQVHELRGAHSIGEPLRAVMARRAISRENRLSGFASFQVFGSHLGCGECSKPHSDKQTAPNCEQFRLPSASNARFAINAPDPYRIMGRM
jgi:hypothetical protein